MTDDQDRSRDTANPSIFVIQTNGARGAKALEQRLDPYSGGSEAGHSLIQVGPDEWFLARAVQKALRAKHGNNDAVFLWLARQPGAKKVELLRGRVAMKRWYENPQAKATAVDSASPRTATRQGQKKGWFSWNLEMVGAPEAWDLFHWDRQNEPPWRHPEIKVGHLDTGMALHPCLELNDGTMASSGHVLMHEGANVFDPQAINSLPSDPLTGFGTPGHGMRTLSVLCGFQPGLFAGVAPRTNVIPYRVTNFPVVAGVLSNDTSLAEGIRRATVDSGCLVLSMSLGNPCFPGAAIGRTVDAAYEMGVIMVAAAGNVTSEVTYPGRYARTITVGGVSESRRPWTGGSAGMRVDLSAPADDVYRALFRGPNGTQPGYSPKDGDGTSYATTHVSGAAVLWLAHHWADIQRLYGNTWRRVEAFRHCLKESAKPGPNWDSTRHGAGILFLPKLLKTTLPKPADLEKVNDLAENDMF